MCSRCCCVASRPCSCWRPWRIPSAPSSCHPIVTSSFVPPGCCLMCFRLPFCPSGSQSVADLLPEIAYTGTVRGSALITDEMTLGRRIFHRSKVALEFCCVVIDEITSRADGVRRNVDDRIVKTDQHQPRICCVFLQLPYVLRLSLCWHESIRTRNTDL